MHGPGRVDCLEHVTGVCRAEDFPALLARYNSPRCPMTEKVLMDNARWPWMPQRRAKRIRWWAKGEEPGQLIREWLGDDALETSEYDKEDDFVEDDFVPPPTEKVKGENQPDSRKLRQKVTLTRAQEARGVEMKRAARPAKSADNAVMVNVRTDGLAPRMSQRRRLQSAKPVLEDISLPSSSSQSVDALSSMLSHAASVDVMRAQRMRTPLQSLPLDFTQSSSPLTGQRQIVTSATAATPAGHTAPTLTPGSPSNGSEDEAVPVDWTSRRTSADEAHPAGHTAPTPASIPSHGRSEDGDTRLNYVVDAGEGYPAGHTAPTAIPSSSVQSPSPALGPSRAEGANEILNAGHAVPPLSSSVELPSHSDSERLTQTTGAREGLPAGHTSPTPTPSSASDVSVRANTSDRDYTDARDGLPAGHTAPIPAPRSPPAGGTTRGFHTSVSIWAMEAPTLGSARLAPSEHIGPIDLDDEGDATVGLDHEAVPKNDPAVPVKLTKTERAQHVLREQYLPTLEETPFWRPLLTVTLSTRPLAVTLGRLARARPRGTAYFAAIDPEDRKTYLSFSSRMRNMRIDRVTDLTIDIAQLLDGFRGGFVGIRFSPRDRGRTIGGEALARGVPFDKRLIQVGVGSWYARREEVKEAFRLDIAQKGYEVSKGPDGAEPLEVYDVDDYGVRRNDQGEVVPWPKAHGWEANDLLEEWNDRSSVTSAPLHFPDGAEASDKDLLMMELETENQEKRELARRNPQQMAVALAQRHRSVRKP